MHTKLNDLHLHFSIGSYSLLSVLLSPPHPHRRSTAGLQRGLLSNHHHGINCTSICFPFVGWLLVGLSLIRLPLIIVWLVGLPLVIILCLDLHKVHLFIELLCPYQTFDYLTKCDMSYVEGGALDCS